MTGARRAGTKADGRPARAPAILFGGVALALLLGLGLLAYGSGRGFDLTDEVFYLVWTRDPHAYALTYQPFGYLLHPLFQLVAGNLQAYRLAGVCIVAGSGAFLGRALSRRAGPRALFSLYGAAAALTAYFPWIVTPSYNLAANVGALLILGGVLTILQPSRPGQLLGVSAAAAGLCAAAFAKPPLFAISALGLLVAAAAARRARTPLLASLVLGGVLICLILPPPELAALVRRILASQRALHLPNALPGLPAKVVHDALAVPPTLWGAAVAAAASLALPGSALSRGLGYAAIGLTVCYAPRAVVDLTDGDMPDFLGVALVTAGAGYWGVLRPQGSPAALAALLAAPAAIALGTFNNQWAQLNFSMAFPLLALFLLASQDPAAWRRGAAQAVAVAWPAAVLLLSALRPYGLPASIFDQQVPIEAPLGVGRLRVDPQTAGFIAGASGLARGDLIVDLSGTGPGVGAVLGGHAPVLLWLNPATPAWPDVVWSRMSLQARDAASFVVPVWPAFAETAPAGWLAAHRAEFCRTPLPPMTFWKESRELELWRPCRRPRP